LFSHAAKAFEAHGLSTVGLVMLKLNELRTPSIGGTTAPR